MQVGARIKVRDRRNIFYNMLGEIKYIQAADYPWRGRIAFVVIEDGRKGIFDLKELSAA